MTNKFALRTIIPFIDVNRLLRVSAVVCVHCVYASLHVDMTPLKIAHAQIPFDFCVTKCLYNNQYVRLCTRRDKKREILSSFITYSYLSSELSPLHLLYVN